MNSSMLSYLKRDSIIHNLTGATKLLCFIFWALASMFTYDTRILVGMFILSIVIFKLSKVKFKEVELIIYFILFFLLLNNIAIFIFSPFEGVHIYGTRHNLFHVAGPYYLTTEQLFYQFNVTIKYFSVIPMALLFIIATNPSEFAASLNKIGISYRISYSVSIALRYIPDIQRDYQDISFAQQAKGIDMSKKEKFTKRIKNSASILMPLVFSSLERIETISSAMELRGFGNSKKRTWYNARSFKKYDYIAIGITLVILSISLSMMIINGTRFFNPFIN